MYAARREAQIGVFDEEAARRIRGKVHVRSFRPNEAHVLCPDERLEPWSEIGAADLAIDAAASLRFVPLE